MGSYALAPSPRPCPQCGGGATCAYLYLHRWGLGQSQHLNRCGTCQHTYGAVGRGEIGPTTINRRHASAIIREREKRIRAAIPTPTRERTLENWSEWLTPHARNGQAWCHMRQLIFERDGSVCLCGATADTIDHIIPRVDGGTNEPINLRPLCGPCNYRSGALYMATYRDTRPPPATLTAREWELVHSLDALDVPSDAGRRTIHPVLATLRVKRSSTEIDNAAKYRRARDR